MIYIYNIYIYIHADNNPAWDPCARALSALPRFFPIQYIWGLSNKALLFELVSPAFRGPFAFAEKPQVFLSRIVISLFHCTEFTVFGISKQRFQGHGWADALPGNAPFRGPTAGLSRPFRENPCFCSGKRMCHVLSCIVMLCTLYVISLGWHMSFAVLSPAFRGLQFPFRDMYVLTFHLNSFTGNNGRPSYEEIMRFLSPSFSFFTLDCFPL